MLDPKWTGTVVDRQDMHNLNLEQRNFGKLAMFGFASTLLATWEALATTIGVALPNGGTAGLFWNYLIAAVGLAFVYASIAEMGSMFPTSGGQYYWVAVLAPRCCRRFLSYITGMLCAITWQTSVGGGAFVAGTLIQGLFVLNMGDSYNFQRWHGTLLTLAFILVATIFNTVLARKIPIVEGFFVFCHILGVLVFIPLWILLPRRDSGAPLVEFYTAPGGWESLGVATLVGTVGPITALIGFDCSVHMSEEAKDSSLTVPVTLLTGYFVNVALGFFALMTIIYTIGPLDTVLASSATGYPIIDLFFAATNNLHGTNFMVAVVIINLAASVIAALAAASRQLWAFARNNGLPFPGFFAPSHLRYDIPLNSILFSLVIPVIISLLNIGSTEALGIILSIFNSALLASYGITIGCILLHRLQGRQLPQARYALGKWGIWANALALVYIAPVFVFSFFPSAPNPTPASMNWACVMVGGIIFLATIYYVIWGRKAYSPPSETVENYIQRSKEEVSSNS